MTEKLPKATKIPRFKSVEEAAEFFDTHDLSGLGKEVQFKAAKPLRHIFQFEIGRELLNTLISHAQSHDVPIDDLVRRWIAEGVERERAAEPAPRKKARRSA